MTSNPFLKSVPRHAKGYILEDLDDGLYLSHPQEGMMITVNETGALIWGLCDGKRTVREISKILSETYKDNAAAVRKEVPRMIFDFVQLRVINLKEK